MQSSNIFENVSALAWRRLSLDTLHRYRDIVRQVAHRAFHDLDQIAEYETQRFVLVANRNELFPNPKNQFLENPRLSQRLPRYLGLTQQKAVGLQLSCQPKVSPVILQIHNFPTWVLFILTCSLNFVARCNRKC